MKKRAPSREDFDRDLEVLFAPRPPEMVRLARGVMATVARTHPELSRKVRFGWQAVAYRHADAGYVCGVFIRNDRITLLFEQGRQLSDPEGVLEGDGTQVRFISYREIGQIDETVIALYIAEAISLRA